MSDEKKIIYMDSSATSFYKPDTVKEAVYQSFLEIGNDGRGAYAPTLAASRMIYRTREKLARLFGVEDSSRIAFTMNDTESLNIAISGLIQKGDHVITTAMEHNSVLRPLYRKEKEGAKLTILKADGKGNIDYEELKDSIQLDTKAVVITHASNLTGNVTDLFKVSKMLLEKSQMLGIVKPYLIVDAAQTAGILPIHMKKMKIDVLCFTGHKGLLGPQGTGGICLSSRVNLPSFKVGGSGIYSFDKEHPDMLPTALEAGTLNGHGIAGLSAGIDFILEEGIDKIHAKEKEWMEHFINGICEIPNIHFYGDYSQEERAPIVTINLGDMDSAILSDILWEDYAICTRAGAHCAPLMHETFGTVEQGAVRFSFSYFNTREEIDIAILAVKEIAEDM